jgi:CDP-paratose 2-epimerase
MNVLVTGGAGFIGSHVAEFYAKKGDSVTVVDNLSRAEIFNMNPKISMHNWNYLKANYKNINLIKGDVRHQDVMEKLAKNVDAIFHTAAQTAVTTSLTDPRTDFEVNALGTFNMLEAARKSGNHPAIIFCSTNKVFGNNVNKVALKEGRTRYEFADPDYRNGIPEHFSTDHCEHTPYGCSKYLADVYIQDYAERGLIDAGIFRMSCIYGTRQFGVEDQGWVIWFTLATMLGKPLNIYGDGKQVRDVLFVDDLVRAYDAFIRKRNKLHFGVFNMGGGMKNTISLLELLDLLEQETGKRSNTSFSGWRPSDQKVYISDITKAKRILGWEPEISPKAGVKRLVEWVGSNEKLFS